MLARVVSFRTEAATHRFASVAGGGETRMVAGKARLFMEIEVMTDGVSASRNEELLRSIHQSMMVRLDAPEGHATEAVEKVTATKVQEVIEGPDHW